MNNYCVTDYRGTNHCVTIGDEIVVSVNGYLIFPETEDKYIVHEKKVIKLIKAGMLIIAVCDDGTITCTGDMSLLNKTELAFFDFALTLINVKDVIFLSKSLFIFLNDNTLIVYGYAENIITQEFRTNVKTVAYYLGLIYVHYCDNSLKLFTQGVPHFISSLNNVELLFTIPKQFIVAKLDGEQMVVVGGHLPVGFDCLWYLDPNKEFYFGPRMYAVRNKVTNDLHIHHTQSTSIYTTCNIKFVTCLYDSIIMVNCDSTIQIYRTSAITDKLFDYLKTLINVDRIVAWYDKHVVKILVIFNDDNMLSIVTEKDSGKEEYIIKECTQPFMLF